MTAAQHQPRVSSRKDFQAHVHLVFSSLSALRVEVVTDASPNGVRYSRSSRRDSIAITGSSNSKADCRAPSRSTINRRFARCGNDYGQAKNSAH